MVQNCTPVGLTFSLQSTGAWFFPFFFIFAMLQRYLETFKRRVPPGQIQEHWSFWLMTAVYVAVMLASFGEWAVRGGPSIIGVAFLGLGMYAAGLVLRRSAIRALGRFWSVHVEFQDGHFVMRLGPYRYLRHPAYLAMILEVAGIPLVANAWVAEGLAWGLYVPVVLLRLVLEERALCRRLGDEYVRYRSEVPMLIPYRWALHKLSPSKGSRGG